MGIIIKKTASEKLQEKQEAKIDTVKFNANQLINNRFPPFDQRNINSGVKTEIRDRQTDTMVTQSEMNSIISNMISVTEQLETDINNASTLSELEAIDTSESNLVSIAGW